MKIAVVGSSGVVGRQMLRTLFERKVPYSEVLALASKRSAGTRVPFGDTELEIKNLEDYDFSGTDVALFSAGSEVSKIYAPKASAKGCVVIDNSSYWRYDEDVPLIVPQVNKKSIVDYKKKGIIANPNCSTIQMAVALQAIHKRSKLKRTLVSTYQSVSGAGKKAIDELLEGSRLHLDGRGFEAKVFSKPIAFNVIPHIDAFMEDASTKEEWKMTKETQKILGEDILVHANCARVASIVGHAEYINVETEKTIDIDLIKDDWRKEPMIEIIDERRGGGYATPKDVEERDEVFISRIRKDATVPNGMSFWCVSNNLRKGAALNAVEIAEILIKEYL